MATTTARRGGTGRRIPIRCYFFAVLVLVAAVVAVESFTPPAPISSSTSSPSAASTLRRRRRVAERVVGYDERSPTTPTTATTSLYGFPPKKTLGLLTFDLDDSLYPIDVVLDEANAAFAAAMHNFGYDGIQPSDIMEAARRVREEAPPEVGLVLSHTEVRKMAIRKEMEKIILERKLQETADDWATPVSDLSPIVVNFAKK